jgi:L-threonylcarbamoyladenylate synthase
VDELPSQIQEAAAVTLDHGETPGTESTVVDVGEERLHRRGAQADEIETWLSS